MIRLSSTISGNLPPQSLGVNAGPSCSVITGGAFYCPMSSGAYGMRWNKPVNAERQAMVAAAMGHPG
jgi:hypothetical protein